MKLVLLLSGKGDLDAREVGLGGGQEENMAHIRQSRPDSGLGSQEILLKLFPLGGSDLDAREVIPLLGPYRRTIPRVLWWS